MLKVKDQMGILTPRIKDWWCSSRYNAPFRCQLKISSKSTPKLNTSDLTENTPSNATSGAM